MFETYHKELDTLIRFIRIAVEDLDHTVESMTEGDFSRNMDRAWHNINGILIYVNRISRIFWNKGNETRSLQLRQRLHISDNSVFHWSNRSVRDNLDHFDERIDEIESGLYRFAGDGNIGDINTFTGNLGPDDYMRHYDPKSRTIYFAGIPFSLATLEQEFATLETQLSKQSA